MKVRVTLELEVPPDFTEYQTVKRLAEWIQITADSKLRALDQVSGIIPTPVQVVRVERDVSRWEPFPSGGKILDFPSPKRGE